MRLENTLRWQRFCWFLSLDVVQHFSSELALPLLITGFQEQLRSKIDLKTDLPTYGSDPRLKTYRMLTWLRDISGDPTFRDLETWQRLIYAQGGQDRVEEFVWNALAYELFNRSAELNLPGTIRSALKQFHEAKERRFVTFNKRLSEISVSQLTNWDQKAVQAEEATLDSVLTTITNICSSNIFLKSWHEACTRRGEAFLTQIFEVAQNLVLEDASGRLLFSADMLPFPSSWEWALPPNLIGG